MDRVFLYHLELHILLELWQHLVVLVSGRANYSPFSPLIAIAVIILDKFLLYKL